MSTSQDIALSGKLHAVIYENLGVIRKTLNSPADPVLSRYTTLAAKNPRWSKGQLVRSMTSVTSRHATRLGAAAGGLAFLPGWGTALALGAVAASSPKMLQYSVDAMDAVACANGFDLDGNDVRRAARISILYWTIPERMRPRLRPKPPFSSRELVGLASSDLNSLVQHEDEIVLRWGSAVSSWRLAALGPAGTGAFAGAWASYVPIKHAVRAAERFYASNPDPLLV